MDINKLSADTCQTWNDFCGRTGEAWFWHTTKWLDYCVSYGAEPYQTRNNSFYVADDTGILAICPLLLENREGTLEFSTSGSGGYGISPAFRDDLKEERREKIQKLIFTRVDQIAEANNVKRALFRISPLTLPADGYNWLLKYGYFDASLNSQLIDLSFPEDALWGSLRKGHKYDVNRGERFYDIRLFDKNNADKAVFDQYRLLHHKAAGRVTRPLATFEMMYDWILAGEGMLCGISKAGQYVGFSYINIYKNSAFYSSASDDPEFKASIPISHVIQWSIIRWLKANGCRTYEIGTQQFGPLVHDVPSPKDLSISFFKRGFGGRTVPLFRAEKYYDREFMSRSFTERIKKVAESYGAE
jgi:hypothetical protein